MLDKFTQQYLAGYNPYRVGVLPRVRGKMPFLLFQTILCFFKHCRFVFLDSLLIRFYLTYSETYLCACNSEQFKILFFKSEIKQFYMSTGVVEQHGVTAKYKIAGVLGAKPPAAERVFNILMSKMRNFSVNQ